MCVDLEADLGMAWHVKVEEYTALHCTHAITIAMDVNNG